MEKYSQDVKKWMKLHKSEIASYKHVLARINKDTLKGHGSTSGKFFF